MRMITFQKVCFVASIVVLVAYFSGIEIHKDLLIISKWVAACGTLGLILWLIKLFESIESIVRKNDKRMRKIENLLHKKRQDYPRALVLAEYLEAEIGVEEDEDIFAQFSDVPENLDMLDDEFHKIQDNLQGDKNARKLRKASKDLLNEIRYMLNFDSSRILQERIDEYFQYEARLKLLKETSNVIRNFADSNLVLKEFEDQLEEIEDNIDSLCDEVEFATWSDYEETYDAIIGSLKTLESEMIERIQELRDVAIKISALCENIPLFVQHLLAKEGILACANSKVKIGETEKEFKEAIAADNFSYETIDEKHDALEAIRSSLLETAGECCCQ